MKKNVELAVVVFTPSSYFELTYTAAQRALTPTKKLARKQIKKFEQIQTITPITADFNKLGINSIKLRPQT